MKLAIVMAAAFLGATSSTVSGQVATRFDLVISEIFVDPTPSKGLPPYEFIEITNVSGIPRNLKGWKIGDASSFATVTSEFLIQPGSCAVLCSNAGGVAYGTYGNVISVSSFPSLDNNSDQVVLISSEGLVIHAVAYDRTWYKNDLKSDGGWSLEMIDIRNPCEGLTNWSASMSPDGGTPGQANSITGSNPDKTLPALIKTFTLNHNQIVAVFNEPLDSLSACDVMKYKLDRDMNNPLLATPAGPLFSAVTLEFGRPLLPETTYELSVMNLTDCQGNPVGGKNITKAGLPSEVDTSDIVVNEILFNPKNGGFDFIEFYNRSKKVIDLQQILSANRNATGGLNNISPLSEIPCLLFPGEFAVFTENKTWLRQNYVLKDYDNLYERSSLPSLPDDKGAVVITSSQGKVIDEIHYDSKWHFALIENPEGISLERVDYSRPTQDKNNWTSAASTAGFATPGYQNSQFKTDLQMQGLISVDPKIFSPDNDGFDDIASIKYQMAATGFVANITIFDASGRVVRYLAKNATLALQGIFTWDGLNDQLQRLPAGIYIVFTEIFNMQGKTKKFKTAVTLARKF